ncbi:TPA: tail fiber assembly protein [Salmonella enterica subsp. enterica serovar Newport]|nr:tail fiber assembly protein [Salmonella enterica subsp. enterica serovar Manchester]ECO0045159.1 tail fiber assembly protein [Salmonella enterica subsp. enterica serovar Infantis]EDG5393760.1 tail fiber assembly protein [Salmonella enterica subsp. enterica serovar Bovismorbificans]EDT6460763.1 tail fiber assembly protein [Salmonella enterica subsp. enterica]HAU3019785.1 tail fiber assembly protein [Salmonella enterica]
MLHLKNITAGNPRTAEQYKMTKRYAVTWLFSEDGKNWYEEIKNFASDTIKIAYATDGHVIWTGKDVSGIAPCGLSVIELSDITANRRITAPGYWFYRNGEFVFDYAMKAENKRRTLLKQNSSLTSEWEKDLLSGIISDENKEKLKANRIYTNALREMDFSQITDKASYAAITWPVPPQNIAEDVK